MQVALGKGICKMQMDLQGQGLAQCQQQPIVCQ